MLPALGQRLDAGARRFLPLATALLFVLLSSIAWPLPYFGALAPSLGLIAVYYWSVHRPDLFTPLGAFSLGLLYDIIHFLPLGLYAFVFVAVHALALSQRRFFVGHAFFMMWTGFALIMAVVIVGGWGALSALYGHWLAFLPVFLQGVMTIVVFPLFAWVLIVCQRYLLSQV